MSSAVTVRTVRGRRSMVGEGEKREGVVDEVPFAEPGLRGVR
jgi:hypothetical protein